MTSPTTVIVAVLGWLLATAGVAEDDRGLRRVPIRDPQGQEVGWYEGSYALLIGVSDYTAGWPDLELFIDRAWWRADLPWSPIFLEIKTPKGRVSPAQTAVHAELQAAGCAVEIVRSVEDVTEVLGNYLTSGGDNGRSSI